jgi:peptidoglycan LD-endopeptidase CwlK
MIQQYFNGLVIEFRDKALEILDNCDKLGYTMYPFEGLRTPQKQADYWCKGRSLEEINKEIASLAIQKAFFLANLLKEAERNENAEIITSAIPGLSWHQWGEALDCFWLKDEQPEWDIDVKVNGYSGYEIYALEAQKLGIESGYYWQPFKDAVHIQLTSFSSPLQQFSLEEIDKKMQIMFS